MQRPVRREPLDSQRSEYGCIPAAIILETVKACHTFVLVVKHSVIKDIYNPFEIPRSHFAVRSSYETYTFAVDATRTSIYRFCPW